MSEVNINDIPKRSDVQKAINTIQSVLFIIIEELPDLERESIMSRLESEGLIVRDKESKDD